MDKLRLHNRPDGVISVFVAHNPRLSAVTSETIDAGNRLLKARNSIFFDIAVASSQRYEQANRHHAPSMPCYQNAVKVISWAA